MWFTVIVSDLPLGYPTVSAWKHDFSTAVPVTAAISSFFVGWGKLIFSVRETQICQRFFFLRCTTTLGIFYSVFFFFFCFFAHFYFPASGQAVVTGVIHSPPRFLPSIFIAHRVQQSHCSSIVHRMLLAGIYCYARSNSNIIRLGVDDASPPERKKGGAYVLFFPGKLLLRWHFAGLGNGLSLRRVGDNKALWNAGGCPDVSRNVRQRSFVKYGGTVNPNGGDNGAMWSEEGLPTVSQKRQRHTLQCEGVTKVFCKIGDIVSPWHARGQLDHNKSGQRHVL